MSVNTVPRFIETPKAWMVKSNATTNTGGSGTNFDLVTAGNEGSKIDQYICTAEDAVEDSLGFVFLETAGGTTFLLDVLAIPATSAPAANTEGFATTVTPTKPHIVPNGMKVVVGATSSQVLDWVAIGGDY